jgi:hypothetical protein
VIRRFVYDAQLDAVVELGLVERPTAKPGDRYADAHHGFKHAQDESAGRQLREAALERADRRVWAHGRFGDERRWRE